MTGCDFQCWGVGIGHVASLCPHTAKTDHYNQQPTNTVVNAKQHILKRVKLQVYNSFSRISWFHLLAYYELRFSSSVNCSGAATTTTAGSHDIGARSRSSCRLQASQVYCTVPGLDTHLTGFFNCDIFSCWSCGKSCWSCGKLCSSCGQLCSSCASLSSERVQVQWHLMAFDFPTSNRPIFQVHSNLRVLLIIVPEFPVAMSTGLDSTCFEA